MSVEIERKFVLCAAPERLAGVRSARIEQGYLAIDELTEVRLRRFGERTLLTVKQGAGERRVEREVDISDDVFDALWPLTEGRRIEKQRFQLDDDGYRIEVDVYEGELEGLVVAEIEFESEEEGAAFEPPDWIGREATGDPRYSNQQLAREGIPAREARP